MRLTPLRRSGLLGAATVAAVATLALATTALADTPTTDDTRATPFDKNATANCSIGGLTGTVIGQDQFKFTGGDEKQDLDITAVPAGVTVTGVVVKGGDAYNVYLAAKLGATLPWNDLRSPINNGGNIPDISHWYACGVVTEQPPAQQPPKQEPPKQEQPPSSSAASPSSSTAAAPTSTSAVAGASDQLASTGFGSAWLIGLGAALVAAGAAVLLVLRRRRSV